MMYGDQWNCSCGWANFFLRKRCRNCGKEKYANAAIDPAEQVINRVLNAQSGVDNATVDVRTDTPMKSLVALFISALAFIQNLKSRATDLTSALADRDALITDLKGKLDADQADHAALIARAKAAEAHSAQLDQDAAALNDQSAQLADAINDHPQTPNVDPATFAVTAPAPESAPAGDAAPAPAAAGDQAAPAAAGDTTTISQ